MHQDVLTNVSKYAVDFTGTIEGVGIGLQGSYQANQAEFDIAIRRAIEGNQFAVIKNGWEEGIQKLDKTTREENGFISTRILQVHST